MNEEREEVLRQLREKRNAYLNVFGETVGRTKYQQIVLDDINRFCKLGDEIIHMNAQGSADPLVTFYRLGKQSVADRIAMRLEWREPDDHRDGNPSPLDSDD